MNSADLDDTRILLNRFYYPIAVGVPEGADDFKFRADVIQHGTLTVGQLGFGAATTLAASDLDAYHLTIPVTGKVHTQHAGVRAVADPGRAVIFGPELPVYTLHDPNSTELDVKIDRAALEGELSTLLGHRVTGPLELPSLVDLSTGPMRSWSRLVRLLRGEITHPSSMMGLPIIAGQLRHAVISGLLLSVPHRYSNELSAPAPAGPPRAIQRVVDAIHDEPERPFTVADLAGIAGVSVRSLQEGFRRYVGSAPMAYLQQVRLTRAHETLRREDPARTTVASVAHRWGFAHLGRFASSYRGRYGVSPSETLRDNR
ncbi:AraC family transcriptional regulator [Actinoplanes sp. TFC3]|uniref:helix-turn-helix transcriptional regulator n=1 Tax=Actinoplanes sp. TFC3 TaxID=1710355 RepID=UPI001F47405E|nr:AraC family transcriptional regulator [Actinoplanes sp. TFC3]